MNFKKILSLLCVSTVKSDLVSTYINEVEI